MHIKQLMMLSHRMYVVFVIIFLLFVTTGLQLDISNNHRKGLDFADMDTFW